MPETPFERPLLLGLAARLGPLLELGRPILGLRLGDLGEELGARAPASVRALHQAVAQLVRTSSCSLEAFPGTDPMTDAGTRVLLTAKGLAAARGLDRAVGQPLPEQAHALAVDLGSEFAEGRLATPRLTSTPAPLGGHAQAEPWILPVLLLLGLEPRWYLNVLATLLQFLARTDRIELGAAGRTLATAKGLGERCAALVPFLPGLYLGKDHGQRTLGLIAPLPATVFTADGEELSEAAVHAVLGRAFGLKGIDPLARLKRNTRAGREAVGGDEGGEDEAPPDADEPPEE